MSATIPSFRTRHSGPAARISSKINCRLRLTAILPLIVNGSRCRFHTQHSGLNCHASISQYKRNVMKKDTLRRILPFCIFLSLTHYCLSGDRIQDSLARYHPLQNGTIWIYRAVSSGPGISGTSYIKEEVLGDTLFEGLTYKKIGMKTDAVLYPTTPAPYSHMDRIDSVKGIYYSLTSYDPIIDDITRTGTVSWQSIPSVNGLWVPTRYFWSGGSITTSIGYAWNIGKYSTYRSSSAGIYYRDLVYFWSEGITYGVAPFGLKDPTTSVSKPQEPFTIPIDVQLKQNYPNPANPTTQIGFTIPEPSFVRLTIVDLLGRIVETPIQQYLPKGDHSITWNGSAVTSGVYLYRIEAGTRSKSKVLILLK